MDDILARVQRWMERGEAVALATIVEVERKAPRGPGAAMAVSARRVGRPDAWIERPRDGGVSG